MMARIAVQPEAFSAQRAGKPAKRAKEPKYLDWIRTLPCVVTGRYGVQAAHVSFDAPEYGKLGRGKGQKEDDRWALPLNPEHHRRQHEMAEKEFWRLVGIDPCRVALALHGAFPSTELALVILCNARAQPNLYGPRMGLLPASTNPENDGD